MNWLDKTITDYEKKKLEEDDAIIEENNKREELANNNGKAASEALIRAHAKLQTVKTGLSEHHYTCEVALASQTVDKTGAKYFNKLTFLLMKRKGEKLDSSSSRLEISAGNIDDLKITKIYEDRRSEKLPSQKIKIDKFTNSYIDSLIEDFIKQIFKI